MKCAICGKEFANPNAGKRGRPPKYCSAECRAAAKKPVVAPAPAVEVVVPAPATEPVPA